MEGVDTNEAHIHHHDGPSVAMGGIDGGNNRAADINETQFGNRGHHHRNNDEGCTNVSKYL